MTNKTELLPCPFCGGKAKVSRFPGAHNVWCENQPVKCGNRSMFTAEQWNARALTAESATCAKSQVGVAAEDVRAVVDEPVAWEIRWADDDELYLVCANQERADRLIKDPDFKVTPLYRHPHRPVVLPKRPYADDDEQSRMTEYDIGIGHGAMEMWDKIAELNK